MLIVAEIDPMRIARLEQELAGRSALLVWIYGTIIVLGLIVDAALLVYWRARGMRWDERIRRLLWRPWSGREVLLLVGFLGILQLTALHSGRAISSLGRLMEWREESLVLIVETFILHVAGLAMVAALVRRNRVSWKSAFGMDLARLPVCAVRGAVFLLAAMPPLLFYTLIYHLALQLFGVDVNPQDVLFAISEETSWFIRILFVALAAVLAPAFEEILFRGILLPVLSQRLRAGSAIAIVSCLFALLHWNVASFVPLFALSVSFCLAYIYTGSLFVPVFMHSLFNLITVSLLLSVE
jgi:hypothetical protein